MRFDTPAWIRRVSGPLASEQVKCLQGAWSGRVGEFAHTPQSRFAPCVSRRARASGPKRSVQRNTARWKAARLAERVVNGPTRDAA